MNVIVVNRQENIISSLNIEVIKSMRGVFTPDELIGTFANFFFARMIIDVTALQNFEDAVTYQKLSIGLPIDKIILLIPPTSQLTNNFFISKLISMGYYNFTTNADGIRYLLANPNSYKDVASLHQLEAPAAITQESSNAAFGGGLRTLGVKNITDDAGASTLIYMMKKVLEEKYRVSVRCIEVDSRDFVYFRDKNMVSCERNQLASELLKSKDFNIILVDLNGYDDSVCDDTIYLVEPSVIKLNKLMMRDRGAFAKLKDKKIIINRCVLNDADIREFAREAMINIFYTLPVLNDREMSNEIDNLLKKIGLIS